ncbi:MAG: multidrug transporter [candidate division Zixibacteria bacterium]|nr:multidrug transporter [candidate division Zixibacteria bacterium]
METKAEKILYITTIGAENPEKAAFPFVLANAALAMDIEATIVMQGSAVEFAKTGFVDTIPAAGGLPPMKKLLADFLELGGKTLVCGPCIKEYGVKESELVAGAEVTAAAQINIAALAADAVLVY